MLVVLHMVKYAQDYKFKKAKSCRGHVMKVDSKRPRVHSGLQQVPQQSIERLDRSRLTYLH